MSPREPFEGSTEEQKETKIYSLGQENDLATGTGQVATLGCVDAMITKYIRLQGMVNRMKRNPQKLQSH